MGSTRPGYPRYAQLMAILAKMHADHESVTWYGKIGDSKEGRAIPVLGIGEDLTPGSKPEVLFVGGTHGCEPLSVAFSVRSIAMILEGRKKSPEIRRLLRHRALWFIPIFNPDGSEIWWSRGVTYIRYRKNSNKGSPGIDLNRNFSVGWRRIGKRNIDYGGPVEFSEPESRAMRDFVKHRKFRLSLSYHTFGQQFAYPWCHKEDETDDDPFFKALTGHLRKVLPDFTAGVSSKLIHVSRGDLDDWLYDGQTDWRTFPLTIELGRKIDIPLVGPIPTALQSAYIVSRQFLKARYLNFVAAEIASDPYGRVFSEPRRRAGAPWTAHAREVSPLSLRRSDTTPPSWRTASTLSRIEYYWHRAFDLLESDMGSRNWVEEFFQRGGKFFQHLRTEGLQPDRSGYEDRLKNDKWEHLPLVDGP